MAQSPLQAVSPTTIGGYLKNWDALSSMIVRGRSFSGFERNCAFLNPGPGPDGAPGRFADVSAASGLDLIDDGRALASCDWDGDGDLDFWLTNRGAPRIRFLKNNLPSAKAGAAIMIEVEGTECNRDGIGAVVALHSGGRTLTRVVRAGDGFMSQSSKRLHFGLGDSLDDTTASVVVHWPGGGAEQFPGLARGGRYRLVQGSGVAQEIKRQPPVDLAPKPLAPLPTSEAARVVLTERHRLDPIEYVDFAGELRKFGPEEAAGSPVLINLWSSVCAPCLAELADFRKNHPRFKEKGLRILALTTEGVPIDGSRPDLSDAMEFAERAKLPFLVGATDANTLRLLTVLHNKSFVRERPLPLPTSLLIDRHGRLAVVYRGAVTAGQVLADLNLIDASGAAITEAAFPFASRDGLELFRIAPLNFAKAYQDGGYIEEARAEAMKAIEAPATGDPQRDAGNRARAWYYLGTLEQSQREWKAAAVAYGKAVEIAPGQPLLQVARGVVLWQSGATEEAEQAFSAALRPAPDNPQVLDALAKAHLQIEQPAEAIAFLERALATKPDDLPLHLTLALAHEKAGDAKAAELKYREILTKHAGSSSVKNNLAYLLATTPDDSVRNGEEALALAREVVGTTKSENPAILNTLAAAQAASGDFASAIQSIDRALALARATGRDRLIESLREKRALYAAGQPFRSE